MSGSGTKFKKRDLQRYRKIYPYVRRQPRYVLQSEKEVTMEVGEITFTNTHVGTYIFQEYFQSAPTITGLSVEIPGNTSADVNVFVKSVSTTELHIETSQTFTGKVHFHAVRIAP